MLAGSREDPVLRHRLLASYCVLCLTDRQSSLRASSKGTDLVLKGFPLLPRVLPLLILCQLGFNAGMLLGWGVCLNI